MRRVETFSSKYLSPTEVLVAADVQMNDGLAGEDVAAILTRTRSELMRETPVIARLYLTPVT